MSGEQIGLIIVVIIAGFMLGQGLLILLHRLNARREQKRRDERRKTQKYDSES